ncbi:hypothetical protein ACIQAA_29360 [Neobacillus sp. NPDC093182]|uniref:hypothetical protein n=1 Tax=Neobacillus sp. NPDC093182 TaxID=3364297 RepID=UPI0037F8D604
MSGTQMDRKIEDYLDSYSVDFPNADEMESSIEYIMAQVGPVENRVGTVQGRAKALVSNSIVELQNFGWMFWNLNSIFLVLGIISLVRLDTNPYLTAFFLAPLPFIVGLFEIMKSKEEGLIELEMTFQYNTQQVLTSRLLVVGFYNLLINFLVSAVCIVVNPEVVFIKLFFSWTVPYVFVSGLAFLFALQTRGTVVSGILLAIWFALCYGAFQIPHIRDALLKIEILPALGTLLLGVLLWIIHFIKIKKVGRLMRLL